MRFSELQNNKETVKRTISCDAIIWKTQNLNYKDNFIIGTCFHSQDAEKHKKDKIVHNTLFFQIVSFYHFSVPEELGNSEIFFAILILIGNRKRVFTFIKTKNITYDWGRFSK